MSGRDSDSSIAKVGVIGTSKRAGSYFRHLSREVADAVQVAALADPDTDNRRKFEKLICPDSGPRHYSSGTAMLNEEEELDAVVIASPNAFHAEDAVQVISRGIPLLLEKPVAISVADCARLWEAHQRTPRSNIFVGFVLRYTPFYVKVKEIVGSGILGGILTIDVDESVGTYVTSVLHQGWRRHDTTSGGFIVEKCCHDMDIINWLVSATPERVFSIGRRTHFVPRPASERHSRFDVVDVPRGDMDYGDAGVESKFFVPGGGSPYDISADSPDHQAVMIEYSQGTLCTLTAVMGQPRPTRRIRIYGSNGSLSGDIEESRITIDMPHRTGNGWAREEIRVDAEATGHHGGDTVIQDAFWSTVTGGESVGSRAGVKEGIESVLVGIAAEQARASGQPVLMSPLREEVFGVAAHQ